MADWKEKLTPEQYNICFLKGTESPGSGKYYKHFEAGAYHCVACGQKLFSSDTKYDSKTGWPASLLGICIAFPLNLLINSA